MVDSDRPSTQGSPTDYLKLEGTTVPEAGETPSATSDWEVAVGKVAATRAGAPLETKATSESGQLELPVDKPEYKPIKARINDD